ncbi:MAG: MazG family protein [Clostridia bacterium]|nr:MazG family protein [Clostridia bacterium]
MKKDFNELLDIIRRLRAPGGCPWDREQTHMSLKKHLIEEAYEAADAIDEGDCAKIADELGDVLLQIVMHAQIGAEEGTFDINDVTDAICTKMIVRHPHVFADVTAETSEAVLKNWEDIKKRERGQKTTAEAMEAVTRSLPSLTRGVKIISKADKAGMLEALNEANASFEEDMGKRLFEICLECYKNGIDPEEELYSYTKKFIKKFKNIEENT